MKFIWKFLGIFLIIWIIWYFTGGPQRTTNVKPYVKYNYDTTQIEKSNTELQDGTTEILPVDTVKEGADIIKDNLQN